MESTELTKVNLSTLRGQEVAARPPAAMPSGSLGSLAFLPSSFLGSRFCPSARTIAAGSGQRCEPSSLGSVGRLVPSFPLRPGGLLPPAPSATLHPCGVFVVWGLVSLPLASLGGSVATLRLPPLGCAFGALARAWEIALRASLCPVWAASVASPALLSAALRLGGLRAPSGCSFSFAVRGVCRSGVVSNRHNRLAFGSAAYVHL